MEKSYLCQLKALINSFNFFLKHSLKKALYIKRCSQKYGFPGENSDPPPPPPLERKVKLRPKIFHDYLSWDKLYQ